MEKDDMDMPALVSDSDSDSAEWDDDHEDECVWGDDDEDEKMNMLSGDVTCLFCSKVESSVDGVISHCKADHHFDIPALCQRWSVDCISYIKMVNFCRKEHPSPDQVIQALMSGGVEWQDDQYMQTSDHSDLMLQFDIESVIELLPTLSVKDESSKIATAGVDPVPDFNQPKQSSEAFLALAARTKAAEGQCDLLKDELGRVLQDMEKLRMSGQQLVLNMSADVKETHESKSKKGEDLGDEDGYFASYSHHGIHMTMLKDAVRTESYRDFMLCNRHLFEGKAVLDVGCGTGILSMFAVKAGARHVVAVDSSQIIYQAMDIARENNMHEKITFIRGRVEEVTLPIEKFDVIISEWMGYFLLFEAMLDSVLWARDHYLAPGGCVYPDLFEMKVVGVSDPELFQQTVGYWDDVYGFKMSCMKRPVFEEVQVCTVQGSKVVTEPTIIQETNVQTCKVTDLDFHSKFSLTCEKDAELTAIVGYFDTYFGHNCQQKIEFSTGPKSTRTHWEQAVMILPKALSVKKGSSIPCQLTYRKHPHDSRGVIINLTVGDLKQKYSLS